MITTAMTVLAWAALYSELPAERLRAGRALAALVLQAAG